MSGFAALMALSASQTKATQHALESVIQQRKRNEELRIRQQQERERKERELEQKIRLKHFEDQKREQERQLLLQKEAEDRERLLQRRVERQREALRYGPKKSKAISNASSTSPNEDDGSSPRRHRRHDAATSSDNDPSALTREEKRERKLLSELGSKPRTPSTKRTTATRSKLGAKLPGGAINITVTPGTATTATTTGTESDVVYRSVKERIAAQPNVLTKLNTVKRDTRTIDEILQDRAKAQKAKVLAGDDAREFSDWFGKGKKKDQATKRATSTAASTPTPETPRFGTDTPPSTQSSSSKGAATSVKAAAPRSTWQGPSSFTPKQPASAVHAKFKATAPNASNTSYATKSNPPNPATPVNGRPATKKRPRSLSLSDSPPPPAKRRASPPTESQNDIRAEIWKMFGKDRSRYMQSDIFSDDEDMEAGASLLEKEERISSRIAIKEDLEALEAERRHEEEKRRRKKEKDRRG